MFIFITHKLQVKINKEDFFDIINLNAGTILPIQKYSSNKKVINFIGKDGTNHQLAYKNKFKLKILNNSTEAIYYKLLTEAGIRLVLDSTVFD